MIAGYGRLLSRVLNHPWLTLGVAIGTLVLTIVLWVLIPKGFFPQQDNGLILANVQGPQNVSWTSMTQRTREVTDILEKDPDVANVSAFVGIDGTNPSLNNARLQITLKPLSDRHDRIPQIEQRLQQSVSSLPGISLWMQAVQDLTIDTEASRTPYQFTLQSPSQESLAEWIPKLLSELQKAPQLREVSSNWQDQGNEAFIRVDRDTASRLGITMADIDNALYDAFGQRLISTIYTQSSQYRVVLSQQTGMAPGLQALQNIRLTNSDGGTIPLTSIARVEQRHALLAINHLDQFPAATVSFDVASGYSLGEAVNAITDIENQLNLPSDMLTHFQGSTLAFKAALSGTVWLVIASIVAMYIVLGILYESFIHPVTILSTLPTAGLVHYWHC